MDPNSYFPSRLSKGGSSLKALGILFQKFLFLLFLFLGLFPSLSYGQTLKSDLTSLSLEELMKLEVATVSGASRYEQKVTQAPSLVSVITADEIKKYGHRTLADILQSLRSFFITYDRNYHYAGVRGFGRPGDYNSRILLLVDGHRVNENIYGYAPVGTEFPLDVDLIDRIEVIRGPSSSLYGTGAFFGVISVITRKGKDLKGPEVSGEVAGFETYKGRATYGKEFKNGLEMLLSGTYYKSEGPKNLYYAEYDDPSTNSGIASHVDGDRFASFFSKVSYRDFTLSGAYSNREKELPTGSWGTVFNDPQSQTKDEWAYLDLKYDHTFDNQLNVLARLFYDQYLYRGIGLYDYPPPTIFKDWARGEWWGGELKITKPVFEKLKLTVGGEYQGNPRQDQHNYDEDPYFLYVDSRKSTDFWAAYFQGEFNILKNVVLNAGARHDYYSTFGGTTNPRIALIYSPFENAALKLLYGQAFRAPNVYELFYEGGGVIANPNLKPEKITTYELAWEQYFAKYFRGVAAVYHYRITDLIEATLDPTGDTIYMNKDEIEATGVELELEGKHKNGLQGRISYAFQETRNKETGGILTNSPQHLAKFNLIVPLIGQKLFSGLELRYMSTRKTLADREASDFFITNLTLFSQNLLKGLELSATIYNLFDRKYSDLGGVEHLQDLLTQDGITYRLKLTYRF